MDQQTLRFCLAPARSADSATPAHTSARGRRLDLDSRRLESRKVAGFVLRVDWCSSVGWVVVAGAFPWIGIGLVVLGCS